MGERNRGRGERARKIERVGKREKVGGRQLSAVLVFFLMGVG